MMQRDGLPPPQLGPEIKETAEEEKTPRADGSSQGFCWCDCVRLCGAPLFPEVCQTEGQYMNMMMFVC